MAADRNDANRLPKRSSAAGEPLRDDQKQRIQRQHAVLVARGVALSAPAHGLRLHPRKNRLSPPQTDLLSRGLEFALFCFNDSIKLAAVVQRG